MLDIQVSSTKMRKGLWQKQNLSGGRLGKKALERDLKKG